MISMSAPVWVIEGLGIRASIRRSRELSKGSRLRIFVACLAPSTLGWVSTITLSRALVYLRSSCPFEGPVFLYRLRVLAVLIPRHGWCVSTSAVDAILTLVGPIFPIALTLFYYDQRMRLEGYDIERMIHDAGLHAPALAAKEEAQP
jgi:hypothetical protein